MDFSHLHLHWGSKKNPGKEYKSCSLARSIRVNDKVRKAIVIRLGKLSDEQVAQWRHILHTFKTLTNQKEAQFSKIPKNHAPKEDLQKLMRAASKKQSV